MAPFTPQGAVPDPTGPIDLAHAVPAAPVAAMQAAAQAALTALPRYLPGSGYDVLGLPLLREAVARHLTAGGLTTGPDSTCTPFVQRALVRPGDRVVIDHPTYPNSIGLIQYSSAGRCPWR